MNLLLSKNARLIGQGITGVEGRVSLSGMLAYGTRVVAGVTPGKGGQTLESIPIFNTVAEALDMVGPVNGSVQFVPPLFIKTAVVEAIEAGIRFILIGAEKVPTRDAADIVALARSTGAAVVGPSSVGIINPARRLKIGAIGGNNPDRVYCPGNVAVISKSGGMTSEISLHLKQNGLGVSWAAGIGGDRIIGSDFADWLQAVERDPATKASVIFGELGGLYEEAAAALVKSGSIKKPVVAFIAGEFASRLPTEVQFGHAGALIESDRGRPERKREALARSGVRVAKKFDDISRLVKEVLSR